ncbi:hypothetical protein GCM10010329_84850 [Streptomyces spiroverticillatus]|uniref:Uncharacterized protein n=1 Tax=Streptomyces finlayi TaxID=67296 RepID=A0A918XA94_9ACTN|nr:hypothetical protein [Streptomyces finlayi]GHA49725.1 hypothetical protein GCM10010329_84850 [Streptomyces spiroverticillatus]GHD19675.1 hypothetical protein GCM10010334_83580 [Streptomyces finlayi]
MPVPVPYVTAYTNELGPRLDELTVEIRPNRAPQIAYVLPTPNDRDAHGNLWARMTRPPEGERGRPLFESMDPLRQRECMQGLLCQVCAKPAEREDGTLFIEWQHANEPPIRLDRIITDMPPLCPSCVPVSLKHCRFLRDEKSAVVLLVRKSVPSGVSGTLFRVVDNPIRWTTSENDAYCSFNKPRQPALIAQRLYRKLRGVTVVDPDSLPTV